MLQSEISTEEQLRQMAHIRTVKNRGDTSDVVRACGIRVVKYLQSYLASVQPFPFLLL